MKEKYKIKVNPKLVIKTEPITIKQGVDIGASSILLIAFVILIVLTSTK